MISKLFSRAQKNNPRIENYELTYVECADFLLQRMHDQEPPFSRDEWHLATVKIPSEELDATFELINWMNSLSLFVLKVAEYYGNGSAQTFASELVEQLVTRLPDSGPTLAMFFDAIVSAPPLASDHPIFDDENCARWSTHTDTWGRAKAALDHVNEINRNETLRLLGPCMIYGTHCSLTRFGTVIPKLRFIQERSEQAQTD